MVIGSLADSAGRRPAYCICFVIYIAANIGCALAPNYEALLVLRMLQSAGSSSTIALCQAVVADIVTSAERGSYVAYINGKQFLDTFLLLCLRLHGPKLPKQSFKEFMTPENMHYIECPVATHLIS